MSEGACDYLVVGAGAASLAFLDALISRSDAHVLVVERRDGPGGHWRQAYPFVRLHQPSAFYGVESLPLGGDRVDLEGPNAGLYERATGAEVLAHLEAAARALSATGRVEFLYRCEYRGDFAGIHTVAEADGTESSVTVRRRVVDARYLEGDIPATHRPTFEVEAGSPLLTPTALAQDLPERATVLGAGKTAMDTLVFLLESGVAPDRLRWVRPRDAWLYDRRHHQPLSLVGEQLESYSRALQCLAEADSLAGLFGALEDCGHLRRLDATITPTMFHCATVNDHEVALLTSVTAVIGGQRVRRLEPGRLTLEGSTLALAPDEVVIDATSSGLARRPARPIFEGPRLTLQQVRTCQPTFNAALVAVVEAADLDEETANRLCPPNSYPDRDLDWIEATLISTSAEGRWLHQPEVAAWLTTSRLNSTRAAFSRADDPQVAAALERFSAASRPARANGPRLIA